MPRRRANLVGPLAVSRHHPRSQFGVINPVLVPPEPPRSPQCSPHTCPLVPNANLGTGPTARLAPWLDRVATPGSWHTGAGLLVSGHALERANVGRGG